MDALHTLLSTWHFTFNLLLVNFPFTKKKNNNNNKLDLAPALAQDCLQSNLLGGDHADKDGSQPEPPSGPLGGLRAPLRPTALPGSLVPSLWHHSPGDYFFFVL